MAIKLILVAMVVSVLVLLWTLQELYAEELRQRLLDTGRMTKR